MVSSDKSKPSVSSQPHGAAIVTVAGSELDFYTNSNYLAYEQPQFAAAQREGKLGNDLIDDTLEEGDDEVTGTDGDGDGDKDGEGDSDAVKNSRPSLSDIQVISNEVVFDAANNPTAKIVFKVKNSSGVELKAVNVRVEKK